VPEVLRSGDHGRVDEWRHREAERITRERRPDLLDEQDVRDGEDPTGD
jgi:tRNA (guanine37-N1)-methyltransferase